MINQINKIIFKYLDSQNFVVIKKTNEKTFDFVNSVGDLYPQISYFKPSDCCYIYYGLIDEISSFFSMNESDCREVIGSWVENILQMKVTKNSRLVPYVSLHR
jgi:hypothetical protein